MAFPKWLPTELATPPYPFSAAEWVLEDANHRQLVGMALYLLRRAEEVINQLGLRSQYYQQYGHGEAARCMETFLAYIQLLREWFLSQIADYPELDDNGLDLLQGGFIDLNECSGFFDVYPLAGEFMQAADASNPQRPRPVEEVGGRETVTRIRRGTVFNLVFHLMRYASATLEDLDVTDSWWWLHRNLAQTIRKTTLQLAVIYAAPEMEYLQTAAWLIELYDGSAGPYLTDMGIFRDQARDYILQVPFVPEWAREQAWKEVFNAGFLHRMWEIP